MPKYSPAVKDLKPHERYYLELGRFIQRFAGLEASLQSLLWKHANVSPEVARSIFSGVRVDQALSFIKRLHRAHDLNMHPLILEAFDQIGTINSARNMIIHYGARFEKGEPQFVTNQRIAYRPDEAQSFPISSKILDQLISDIAHIQLRFGLLSSRDKMTPARFEKAVQRLQQRAWRYKHAPEVGIRP